MNRDHKTQNSCRGAIFLECTSAFASLCTAKQAVLTADRRPRVPCPEGHRSTLPPGMYLPPTSENCSRRSSLHWRWPLYLERAQTWPLWRWGDSRTHQNVALRQTASAWGRDLGKPPKKGSRWGNWLHSFEERNPGKELCLPSGSWSEAWSRVWGRESDSRKR